MSGLFNIATPHRNNKASDRSDMGISFGEVDSFIEPAPKDRQRLPLVARSDNPRKAGEFTPLMRTATKKSRMLAYETPRQRGNDTDQSIIENSALTPVAWTTVQAMADKSNNSVSLTSKHSPARSDHHEGPGGIREQEKAMDKMKKENWELKLKLFLMEKQMHQSSPEHVQMALKENIDYKVQITSMSKDIAKYKKALAETERKVASLGDQVSASINEEQCQLPHGMSDAEMTKLRSITDERDTLLNDKEDLSMKIRQLEEEIDAFAVEQERYTTLEEQLDDLTSRLRKSEEVAEEYVELQHRFADKEVDLENMQDELDSLKIRHEELLSQTRSADDNEVVDLLRAQLEDKSELLRETTSKLRNAEREASALQSQLSGLTEQLSTKEQRNDDLESELETLMSDVQSKNKTIEALEVAKGGFEIQLAHLNTDIQRLKTDGSQKDVQIEELQEELREKDEDIEELKGLAQDQSYEFRQLEERLEQKTQKLTNEKVSETDQLETQIADAKLAIRESEREVKSLKTQVQVLQSRLSSSDTQVESAKSHAAELESRLARQVNMSQGLERDISTLQQKLSVMTTRSHELEDQVRDLEASDDVDTTHIQDRLREENQTLRGQIEDLETQVREREEEIEMLESEATTTNNEIAQLRASASQYNVEMQSSRDQLTAAKDQIDTLERQYHSSQDKIVLLQETRNKLQREALELRQSCTEETQKASALNTSLVNVRQLLAEAQASHKDEFQAINRAHNKEKSILNSRCQESDGLLQAAISEHQIMLRDTQVARTALQTELQQYRAQISSMEETMKRLAENEETINLDHAHYKQALVSESERHRARETTLEQQCHDLEIVRDELRKSLSEKAAQAQELSGQLREANVSQDEVTQEKASLSQELGVAKVNLQKMMDNLKFAETQQNGLSSQIKSLENKLGSLQEALSAARRDHQEQLLLKSDDLFMESQKARELQDKLSAVESKLTQAEQEKKRLNLALSAADQRVLNLNESSNVLSSQKQELEDKLEQYTGRDTQLGDVETEKTKLRHELTAQAKTLDNMRVELEEVVAERDLLQEQVDEATEALETLRAESASNVASLRDGLREAQLTAMREAERANKAEADSAQALKTETFNAKQQEDRLRLELSDLSEALKLSKDKHTDLLANLGSSNAESDSLHATLREAEGKVQNLEQQVAAYKLAAERIGDSSQLIADFENQLNDLEDELEDTKQASLARERDLLSQLEQAKIHLDKQLSYAESEKAQVSEDLQKARSKQEELLQKTLSLEDDLAEQRRSIHRLNSEMQSCKLEAAEQDTILRHKLEKALREHSDLEAQLSGTTKEIEQLKRAARSSVVGRGSQSDHDVDTQVRNLTRKVKTLESDLQIKERKVNDLKAYGKDKAEAVASLERRYLTLQSQVHNNMQPQSKKMLDKQLRQHQDELAGLTKMLRYMRSKMSREESFRSDLSFIKSYYDKQITSFEACNQANLAIIRQIGIYPDETFRTRRTTFKNAAHLVLATVRMRLASEQWAANKAEKGKIEAAIQTRRRH